MNKVKTVLFSAGILLALVFTPVAVFAQNEQNPPQGQYSYPPQQQPTQEQYPVQGQYQYLPQGQYSYPQQQQYGVKQEDNKREDIDKDKNILISGSMRFMEMVIDGYEDYPYEGFGFSLGATGFIPLTDVAKFGSGIDIDYGTVSVTNQDDVKLTISGFSLDLSPRIRFGQEKIYADIGLGISIPLSTEMTLKVPGYRTETQRIKDVETSYQLNLSGRYKVIGLGIGKELTGSDKAIVLGAAGFISIKRVEIVPSISYSQTDDGDEFHLGVSFDYFL